MNNSDAPRFADRLPSFLDAIIFDFDGVLAESVDVKTRAFAALYQEAGPDVVGQVIAHHEAHGGVSRFDKIRHYHAAFLGTPLTDDEVTRWADRFGGLVEDAVAQAPEVPGAGALLAFLKDRLPLFIVSGTPEIELLRILQRRNMTSFFAEMRGSPAKKAALTADILVRHQLEAGRVLFIGDATTDFEAACQAGCLFLGRVPAGASSPFPAGVAVVPDLVALPGVLKPCLKP
ncbi:hypothetical protein ROR02_23020 [Pararhodospirillum oryzae]|uniref:phosphoglycolate phosphatase n=2 Tax=Pararhodospirillum oryzae TaxID=478448 RepID=A0A512H9P2_9PROT|nr:hypothetical protein ROR02_23020 [Pararhodospirillum oryzae]